MSFHDGTELREPSFSGKDQIPADKIQKVCYKESIVLRDLKTSPFLTDEASISATPSQPLPPPCSKSQYLAASFSSSNTCNNNQVIDCATREDQREPKILAFIEPSKLKNGMVCGDWMLCL